MSDLIKRNDALDILCKSCGITEDVENCRKTSADGWCKEYCELKNMPAIEAEPVRHSKWIPHIVKICGVEHELGMKCERCGEDALNAEGDDFLTDYCPCCGARMDEREEE